MCPSSSRISRRLVGLSLLCLMILAAWPPASGEPTGDSQWLQARVDSLRADGRFEDALESSHELLEELVSAEDVREHVLSDARRQVTTMRHATELSVADQERLAWSYRIGPEIERLYWNGQYDQAESLAWEQLTIRRELLGQRHPEVAATLDNIGVMLINQNRTSTVDSTLQTALALRRDVLGPAHPLVGLSLSNIGHALQARGDVHAAHDRYRQAMTILHNTLPKTEDPVIAVLINYATSLYGLGDFAAAEPVYLEALDAIKSRNQPNDPYLTACLNNLALVLSRRGDLMGAARMLHEVLHTIRAAQDPNYSYVARTLDNLGHIHLLRQDVDSARVYMREAWEIRKKLYDVDSPELARSYQNNAIVAKRSGDLDEAIRLVEMARAVDTESEYYADELTMIYLLMGRYTDAKKSGRDAIELCNRNRGSSHYMTGAAYWRLGLAHYALGEMSDAKASLSRATEIYESARLRFGPTATVLAQNPYPELAACYLHEARGADAWRAVERSLGRVLVDLVLSRGGRSLERSVHADSLCEAVVSLEGQVEVLRQQGDSAATAMADLVERNLINTKREWRKSLEVGLPGLQPFAIEKIQKSLDPASAIVGWLQVDSTAARHEAWGYVIRDRGPVMWYELSSAADSTGRFGRSVLVDAVAPSLRIEKAGRRAYDRWLRPLEASLGGVRDLVVLPSGGALGLPVEALIDDGGELIGERFAVSYAPSATLYAWLSERSEEHSSRPMSALVLGDPLLRPPMQQDAPLAVEVSEADLPRYDDGVWRSALAANPDAIALLPPLHASREEVGVVGNFFPDAEVLTGENASEQALADRAARGDLAAFDVLHLALHAIVDNEQPERSSLVLSQVGLPDRFESAMAGQRIYDGVLTLNEILAEWRLDADLVTLSACESGLGKEVPGEGYVGFAHGLLQVGARSLLVSLWRVDDAATSLLMQRFYANWVEGGLTKAESLRQAKEWLRTYSTKRGQRPYERPAFWAGFVLIGDRS